MQMADPPNPPRLFHITAIPNLERIAESGALLSKTTLREIGRAHASIAYENIQDRRSRTPVPIAPGGVLHDYVPFHFAPRQPMLNAISRGIVDGCEHQQDEIVHLVLRADHIDAAGLQYVIATHHAVTALADFYGSIADLDKINWDMFFNPPLLGGFARYFHNPSDKPEYATRRESRQAEFLVHGQVPIAHVRGIGVATEQRRGQVEAILNQIGWGVSVRAKPEWYF
jgi:hypothetical protein